MNDKPTRDDYNHLIDQLGPSGSEDGPDIIAVNRRKEEPRSAQPQRRTSQSASSAAHQRQQSSHSRSASASKAQRRQRTASAAHRSEEKHTAPQQPRATKEKAPGFGGGAWMRAIIISLILVAGAVMLALFVMSSATDLFGLNQEDKQVEVNVTEGMSSGDIIDLLEETGVVDRKMTFRFYAGLKDALDEFKPGHYVMNRNFSYDEIIIMLRTGIRDEKERAVVNVTFFEGMTAWEIADRLEENKVCKAEDFIEACNTADFSDYSFVSMIPENELQFVRLEGFLFPDTYQFYVDEKPENAVRRFLDNFEAKVTTDVIAKLNNQNLSLYEGINLASIIQGESSAVEEMGAVSSVFHNRLDNPGVYPMLQSDVSRSYINNDIIPHVDIINNDQIFAYDSYQCSGLPVGPVGNPGLDAILAAANPEDTPYFFFVSDAEANFYYAVTFDEHIYNVRRAGLLGEITGIATEE
ncbi:MAG: endolytic transglycosylase MltG [Oscillospiraceae bacterium]|nr:endolytic transglycosylase MltG [Oscillospiraceae bacterium]